MLYKTLISGFKDNVAVIIIFFKGTFNPIYQAISLEGFMRISHIGVHETRALFSSTISRIYDQEKHERAKVIIFNKPKMDSDTLLFDPVKPKISHSQVFQSQFLSTYVQSSSPVSMELKEQKKHQTSIFDLTVSKIM